MGWCLIRTKTNYLFIIYCIRALGHISLKKSIIFLMVRVGNVVINGRCVTVITQGFFHLATYTVLGNLCCHFCHCNAALWCLFYSYGAFKSLPLGFVHRSFECRFGFRPSSLSSCVLVTEVGLENRGALSHHSCCWVLTSKQADRGNKPWHWIDKQLSTVAALHDGHVGGTNSRAEIGRDTSTRSV